ncbi:unnamed protein product [Pseudo-nitzschia multistriata]|uniref:Uncharacterized protein n=1 Tax=Pseudo-nitzschia multistriata TaxID=183589 RepID=A0A448Z1J8_9STRA|nr:unnamed protein product [Pseudo-nitzschia multistriata]
MVYLDGSSRDFFDARFDRQIQELISDLNLDSANNRRIDLGADNNLRCSLGGSLDRSRYVSGFFLGQGIGTNDGSLNLAPLGLHECGKRISYLGKLVETGISGHGRAEIRSDFRNILFLEERLNLGRFFVPGNQGIVKESSKGGTVACGLCESVEFAFYLG